MKNQKYHSFKMASLNPISVRFKKQTSFKMSSFMNVHLSETQKEFQIRSPGSGGGVTYSSPYLKK